jgi:replicative DNA helicase
MLTESASTLNNIGPFKVIQRMTSQLAKLGRDTRMVRDLDLVNNANERLETLRERIELRRSGRKTLGIPSGITALDQSFGGFMKGDFVVIAGWTGSLKSWLALYMALNAWREGYRVLYFSLEMSGEQLGYRMDTLLGEGLFSHTALTFGLEDITYDHYKTWLGEIMLDKHPFVVVSNEDLDDVTQDTVLGKIEQWKPDITILDYHGLFDDASGASGEVEKTKNLSKAFKRIAIKTGCPIVDITGVTQEKNKLGEQPPELADLAWSKQLAYDSDLTLALCKHGDLLECVSRKTRRGRDFKFYLQWDVDKGIVREIGTGASLFDRSTDDDEDDGEVSDVHGAGDGEG